MSLEILSSVFSIGAIVASVIPLVVKYLSLLKGHKEITTLELTIKGGDKTITIDTSDLSPEKVQRMLEVLHMDSRADSGKAHSGDGEGAST